MACAIPRRRNYSGRLCAYSVKRFGKQDSREALYFYTRQDAPEVNRILCEFLLDENRSVRFAARFHISKTETLDFGAFYNWPLAHFLG